MARKRKKPEPDFPWSIVVVAVVSFVACIIALMYYGDDFFKLPMGGDGKKDRPPVVKDHIDIGDDEDDIIEGKRKINLYFLAPGGTTLTKEKTYITEGIVFFEIQETLELLLAGPKSDILSSALPKGTELLNFEIKDKVVFVDFSLQLSKGHGGGSSGELSTVYAIVNTVMLNFKEIKSVQILIDGEVHKTLAGHIMINLPLKENTDIIS